MIPHYGDKYEAEALFSPSDAVEAQGDGLPDVPPAVVLGYQSELTEAVRERSDSRVEVVRGQGVDLLSDAVGYVAVHESGIGAPVTATVAENVIAAGAEAVAMLGGCAALQPDLALDAAVLPTDAIRDEGVVSLCMESAALWAVADYRGADAATVHEIGDYLAPDEWAPDTAADRGLPEMLAPTVEALERHVVGR